MNAQCRDGFWAFFSVTAWFFWPWDLLTFLGQIVVIVGP